MSTRSARRAGARLRCVVPLALLALAAACGDGTPAEQRAARIAEGVPDNVVAAVTEALDGPITGTFEERVIAHAGELHSTRSAERGDTPLDTALAAADDAWPEALLSAAVRKYGQPSAAEFWSIGDGELDDPIPSRLLRRPAGRLDDELLEIVCDPETPRPLFQMCLASLCRPLSDPAYEGCVDFVLDETHDPDRRLAVLQRLPRFDRPLPDRLDTLLYLPFHRLDSATATLYALHDRDEGLSLLIDLAKEVARREIYRGGGQHDVLVARAALTLASRFDDPALADAARAMLVYGDPTFDHVATSYTHSDEWQARKDVVTGLERLTEAHPELLDTAFERDRETCRARAAAARVAAPEEFLDLLSLTDDEIDFPVAALMGSFDLYRSTLERFERLVLLLGRELAEIPDPDTRIAHLRRRLHGPTRRLARTGPDGLTSSLRAVLHLHCGTCVANTALWVAVGERLGLPVRPVARPGHVAVLWDDGDQPRILETTDRAAEVPMARYREIDPLAVRPGTPDSELLQSISEPEFVAVIAGNEVWTLLHGDWAEPAAAYEQALELAGYALALDRDNPQMRGTYASAAGRIEAPEVPEALALLDESAAREDLAPLERLALAFGYLACDARDRAERLLSAVEEEFPDDKRVIELRELLDGTE